MKKSLKDASLSSLGLVHFFTLLVPPSSRPSFFLVQQCLNYLESEKVHFSAILTKALRTNQPTDRPTNQGTMPLIEMRTHLKNEKKKEKRRKVVERKKRENKQEVGRTMASPRICHEFDILEYHEY